MNKGNDTGTKDTIQTPPVSSYRLPERTQPLRQFELVEKVKAYHPALDEEAINRAYVYAIRKHGTQKRASGDPYFSHPVQVAGILADMHLDCDSIITGLLHDTIEDTDATLEEVERLFGPKIVKLVDGVTKLAKIQIQTNQTKDAENFRKLVLAMSEDIRVLLVKLADRLHNMRTLHFINKPEKRRRIALETMEIFAPLAQRIGMQKMQDELEDHAFAEINSDARNSITHRLEFLHQSGYNTVARIENELQELLGKYNIAATIHGREKTPYAIWRKMERKNISFEDLFDIMAYRIIVPTVDECYVALGVLHGKYSILPGRFKDYISLTKPNGYQSIHSCIIGPYKHRIEVQIRTDHMHQIAEYGVAAHWIYKQHPESQAREQYAWLRDLLEVLEHAAGPEEFLEHTKLAMYQDQVFCFTPRGDLINLPVGATAVDFAYAVHSEVGDCCVGAKINGKLRPLRTKLLNGDQVEINTSKAQHPKPEWERFVVTAKARACIRRFVRLEARAEYVKLGRQMLAKLFNEVGYEYTEKAVQGVISQFQVENSEDLLSMVGEGHCPGRRVLYAVYPNLQDRAGVCSDANPVFKLQRKEKSGLPIKGLISGMAVHFAHCCHPLPGDRIVGLINSGKGVAVHTIDCHTMADFQDQPESWLDLSWDPVEAVAGSFVGRLRSELVNIPGAMADLCTMIAKNNSNINNLKIVNRSSDFFDVLVDVEVKSVKHLNNIIAALRTTPSIAYVDRSDH